MMQAGKRKHVSRKLERLPERTSSYASLACCALIVVLALITYGQALSFPFLNWDDNESLCTNRNLNPPTLHSLGQIWTNAAGGFYVPVHYTSWWLIAHVAEAEPGQSYISDSGIPTSLSAMPFHALNVLAHIGGALVTFFILRRLVAADWPAVAGALVFALHPLQAEPVSWVANSYTPLSGFFALLSIWLFLRFTDDSASLTARGRAVLYSAATLAYAIALLAKPAVLMTPFIIAAIEIGLRQRTWRRLLLPLLPWVLIGMAGAIVTRLSQSGGA